MREKEKAGGERREVRGEARIAGRWGYESGS
jgi:hypothetical protein